MWKNLLKNQKGATVLLVMIVVSAVMLILAVSLGLNSISENQITLYQSQSEQLFYEAEACVEEALSRLNGDSAYSGGNLQLGDTDCTISVSGVGANRTITVDAVKDNYAKDFLIDVKIHPSVYITSWAEITN